MERDINFKELVHMVMKAGDCKINSVVGDQTGESGESMVQLKSESDYVEKKESQYCDSSPNALY